MNKENLPEQDNLARITFEISKELRNAFKATVAGKGQKIKDVLINFVEEYVKENYHKHN